jgi:hypothetical protein
MPLRAPPRSESNPLSAFNTRARLSSTYPPTKHRPVNFQNSKIGEDNNFSNSVSDSEHSGTTSQELELDSVQSHSEDEQSGSEGQEYGDGMDMPRVARWLDEDELEEESEAEHQNNEQGRSVKSKAVSLFQPHS